MDISIDKKENVLIARIRGELDISTVSYFKKILVKKIEDRDIKALLLNLNKVSFIDSSGLGAILGRYRYLDKIGGKIYLVGLKPQVKKILTMAGMLKIMNEYPDEKSALDEINEGRTA